MARILLVEDDDQLSRNLTKFLTAEGCQVTRAAGQAQGLAAFSEGSFDCVLLDLSLTDGNGFAVCAAIRAQSDVPVIFLTASADEACTVAGFEVGADDYIGKPFRPRELIARMKNAMRRHSRPSAALTCQDICIDPAKGTVTKNGAELYLSALEYRLLLVFVTNKNQLLSRDRLIDELWSVSSEFVSDNTLNVYIKRLREKIENDPQNPAILKTVRGMGYKAVDA
ncbi:MAG: response regulator transcription factor [Oscillospiraceae bacterium]|nr:response regulator transcription factor [Oscillospiraceae bacterium]